MKLFPALFFATVLQVGAQTVEVPHKLDFAGITLTIRDDARREIQKDVDALTASPRHYNIKAERAKMYFPIIERIFREEGVPDDFKYLALQESALIPDAVSGSNAVGFWQFKDYTAIEMGLRVDKEIDERLNIASSSRAAARYLQKNNQFFDNWLYALQAYQMGAGGVMKSVEDTQAKASHMEITSKTYWYVKRCLAHKIAFEDGVAGPSQLQVVAVENRQRNTLNDLAKSVSVDEYAVRDLNKWTKSGSIPNDKMYLVLLPVTGQESPVRVSPEVASVKAESVGVRTMPSRDVVKSVRGKINGIHTLQAVAGETAASVAERGGVDLGDFLKWNDIAVTDAVVAGQVYFLGRKRLRGSEVFHKVSPGETLWAISQRYGLQLKRLKRFNRLEEDINPVAGTMLFLASKRPKSDEVIAGVENPIQVNKQETFDWAVKPEVAGAIVFKTDSITVEANAENEAQEAPLKAVDSVKILQTNRTEPTLEDTETVTSVPLPVNNKHTVKTGETLYGIAKMYNLSVMDLVNLNDLDLQEGIHPGLILKLSPGQKTVTEEPANETKVLVSQELFHEVKTSDTLYSIARQYSVTIKEIMEWNGKKDFSLSVGEKLRIIRGQ
jgi:membrane-bound lytic murein transglycosylase D